MWPDRRFLNLVEVELPIVQAPMAGACGPDMAAAVSAAGGLGSLPCAMRDGEQVQAEAAAIRRQTSRPLNLNFFCHEPETADPAATAAWHDRLAVYYAELGVPAPEGTPRPGRGPGLAPFDADMCAVVEEIRPEVVSFHFGLPDAALVARIKAIGCCVISSANSVKEARWLEAHGCDAIIAQGYEAGGHRGVFLPGDVTTQAGTLALVPQVVDAVGVPVIAAGGIADGRGIAAAFALGAAAVQIGTAYLFTPEATISALHLAALRGAGDDSTAITNVFTGRPARGIVNRVMREAGLMSDVAPAFPTAGAALAPLRVKAEAAGSSDFSALWSGEAAALGREMPAGDLTRLLAQEAAARLKIVFA